VAQDRLKLKVLASNGLSRTPQTNGICERFHRTVLNELYDVAFRKKVYQLQEQHCKGGLAKQDHHAIVLHDEIRFAFLDRPRWREAAGGARTLACVLRVVN
jgi:hypothetical protein